MADSDGKNKVLLAGGNGFLGMHLAKSLEQHWQVRIFDRPASRHHGIGDFYPGDIGNSADLDEALSGCDAVVYLVHDSGASPFQDSERLSLLRNLELLLLTIEAAARQGVQQFAFISTGGAVYGVPQCIPVTEGHPLCPISTYGVAKAAMELYLRVAARQYDLKTLIFRPSNPYGPGQNPHRKQGVVSIFGHRILHGLPLEIWGDGNGQKDYLLVSDLTDCMAALMAAGFDGQAYNIASGQSASLLDIVQTIESVTGKQAELSFKQPQANDVAAIVLDNRKLCQRIGQQSFTPLSEGIASTIDWLQRADQQLT